VGIAAKDVGGCSMAVTIEQLGEIVRDVFDDEDVEITEETTARDVEGWDSLNHIRFMVSVEQRFNVRFTSREVESLQNVGDLLRAINSKSPG
jgi:acyl carrier protein